MVPRLTRFTLPFLLLLWFPTAAFTQEPTRAFPVATNFSADGKVLELEISPELDGDRFAIVYQSPYGTQRISVMPARAGTHSYELRQFADWQGPMNYVAVTLPGIHGRVKDPTLSDELDIFLAAERIAPFTVNSVASHTLFGWTWSLFLSLIFIVATGFFIVVRKKPLTAVILGFLVAWTVMDLRTVVDDATIIYKSEKYKQGMPPLNGIKAFSDQAAQMIGRSTWDHGRIEALSRSFLRYRLAEVPFAAGPGRTPVFLVTQNSAEGQILLHVEKFYLVKK